MEQFSNLRVDIQNCLDIPEFSSSMTIDEAIKIIRKNISGDKESKDFSTNGIIAGVTQSIVDCQNHKELVEALLVSSIPKNKEKLVFKEINEYTALKEHYTSYQQISLGSSNKIRFIQLKDGRERDVNILTWFIMTSPPLQFLVPINSTGPGCEDNIPKNKDNV